MPQSAAGLYDKDFARWSEEQSAALREAAKLGTTLPLDWENLAEEVESLGRSQRRELRSRLAAILEHLLKLQCSPAADPRRSWMETVRQQRSEIELLIGDSPSLSNEVEGMIAEETGRIIAALRRYREATPEIIGEIRSASYAKDQVLGDWFPGDENENMGRVEVSG